MHVGIQRPTKHLRAPSAAVFFREENSRPETRPCPTMLAEGAVCMHCVCGVGVEAEPINVGVVVMYISFAKYKAWRKGDIGPGRPKGKKGRHAERSTDEG